MSEAGESGAAASSGGPAGPDPQLSLRDQALAFVRDIPRRREEQVKNERAVVHVARRYGVTWNEIAKATGSAAGWMAREKYGEPEPEGES